MMKDDANNFLNSYAFWIALVVAILILITLVVLIIGIVRYRLKQKQEINEKLTNPEPWLAALGGKQNIVSASGVGSRLKVQLKVKDFIDKKALNALGVTSIITMSDTLILVIEDKAEKISELLN